MDWTKKSLTSYIKDIDYYKNKLRVIDIKLDSLNLEDKDRSHLALKRNEIQNTLDQVQSCINNLDDEDRMIVESNIKQGLPLKLIQLNYSLNSLSRKKNKILDRIVETLNT